jgi:hypothetical protein
MIARQELIADSEYNACTVRRELRTEYDGKAGADSWCEAGITELVSSSLGPAAVTTTSYSTSTCTQPFPIRGPTTFRLCYIRNSRGKKTGREIYYLVEARASIGWVEIVLHIKQNVLVRALLGSFSQKQKFYI